MHATLPFQKLKKREEKTEKERNSDVHRTITQNDSVTYNNSSKVHIEEYYHT